MKGNQKHESGRAERDKTVRKRKKRRVDSKNMKKMKEFLRPVIEKRHANHQQHADCQKTVRREHGKRGREGGQLPQNKKVRPKEGKRKYLRPVAEGRRVKKQPLERGPKERSQFPYRNSEQARIATRVPLEAINEQES